MAASTYEDKASVPAVISYVALLTLSMDVVFASFGNRLLLTSLITAEHFSLKGIHAAILLRFIIL